MPGEGLDFVAEKTVKVSRRQDLRNSRLGKLRNQIDLQLMILPAFLVVLVFSYLPMYGIIIAFKDYQPAGGFWGIINSPWVGLKHFRTIFGGNGLHADPFILRALLNSVGISFFRIVLLFPLPIFLAVMFNEIRNTTIKRTYQTISYFPYFVSWPIICSMVQIWLSPSIGWVNAFLKTIGIISEPITFLSEPEWFWAITLALECWKNIGFSTIIFLAAISGIDQEQYEAATIDGATRVQKIRFITLPSMAGVITILFILQIPGIIGGNFDVSYLLGNASNAERSMILQTYTYIMGMQKARFSYSTAIGLVTSFVSLILLLGGNGLVRKITKRGLF